jgi:hypothetical protein
MHDARRRKFTLLDGIVLIAATAVALVPARYLSEGVRERLVPNDWSGASLSRSAVCCYFLSLPFLVAWSAALWVLRMRKPRPRSWRLYRQPGTAACTAIVVSVMLRVVRDGFIVWDPLGVVANRWARAWLGFFLIGEVAGVQESTLAFGVPFVWLILWLGRACRPEPSWIDRAGRVLGVWCIVLSLVFDWGSRMGYNLIDAP